MQSFKTISLHPEIQIILPWIYFTKSVKFIKWTQLLHQCTIYQGQQSASCVHPEGRGTLMMWKFSWNLRLWWKLRVRDVWANPPFICCSSSLLRDSPMMPFLYFTSRLSFSLITAAVTLLEFFPLCCLYGCPQLELEAGGLWVQPPGSDAWRLLLQLLLR